MNIFQRIYRLHRLISSHQQPVPLRVIMSELECSKATATRCIETLRDYLNAPLEYHRQENGYYYNLQSGRHAFELPGLWFSVDELNGLLICQHILKNISPGILSPHIEQLQQKITQLFRLQPHTPGDIAQKIIMFSHAKRLKDDGQFKKIAMALFNDRQIRIVYQARGANSATQRSLSPQKLMHYRDNWYLVAYCHYRNQLRTFAVDKISNVQALSSACLAVDQQYLDTYLTASYGIFSGLAQYTAILNFTPERARWVADEQWHPAQTSQWLANGDYQLSIPFSDSRELMMDILKYGADVRVIAPPFLVDAVYAQIAGMQKIYANTDRFMP